MLREKIAGTIRHSLFPNGGLRRVTHPRTKNRSGCDGERDHSSAVRSTDTPFQVVQVGPAGVIKLEIDLKHKRNEPGKTLEIGSCWFVPDPIFLSSIQEDLNYLQTILCSGV